MFSSIADRGEYHHSYSLACCSIERERELLSDEGKPWQESRGKTELWTDLCMCRGVDRRQQKWLKKMVIYKKNFKV